MPDVMRCDLKDDHEGHIWLEELPMIGIDIPHYCLGRGSIRMTDEKIEELARHFCEWTDDTAPIRMNEYRTAAQAWADKKAK